MINVWLVVSTHLKNISQNGNLPQPQVGVKIKNVWNHHLDVYCWFDIMFNSAALLLVGHDIIDIQV